MLIFTEKLSRYSWKPWKTWKFSPANLSPFTVTWILYLQHKFWLKTASFVITDPPKRISCFSHIFCGTNITKHLHFYGNLILVLVDLYVISAFNGSAIIDHVCSCRYMMEKAIESRFPLTLGRFYMSCVHVLYTQCSKLPFSMNWGLFLHSTILKCQWLLVVKGFISSTLSHCTQ